MNYSRRTPFQTFAALFIAIIFVSQSCNQAAKKEEEDSVPIVEVDVWTIDEHQINDVPITSKAPKAIKKVKPTPVAKDAQPVDDTVKVIEDAMELEYEIATMEEMDAALAELEYEEMENTVEVTELVIPLEETQTVVAYSKKGKEEAAFQVVSTPDGEVEQIVFTDRKHKDIYDVKAGMSGKEVKQLRKEMKHMVKKGQVFLYDDQSNIMYLMDAKNMVGDEVTTEDVETMDVQAVIWKDKKHHKKNM